MIKTAEHRYRPLQLASHMRIWRGDGLEVGQHSIPSLMSFSNCWDATALLGSSGSRSRSEQLRAPNSIGCHHV
jgi:hypothetical protein